MYSKKILTCMGSLQICSQNNQYDLYWNSFWFQMRQLWKFQQLLIALIYETVTLWPWQVTVQLFNEHLVLRTSYFMLLVEALNLNFCPVFRIWHMTACVRFGGKDMTKIPSLLSSKYIPRIQKQLHMPNSRNSSQFLFLFLNHCLLREN